ncbi:MAG: co-chaperone GroES [Candidatus Buchananbacteria bacterium]
MNIKPLGDRVLVAAVKEEEMTKSGIILPDTAKEKKAEGEVVAVGEGEKVSKLGLKPGQKVICGKYAGDEIKVDDKEYKILSSEDVLAVIE